MTDFRMPQMPSFPDFNIPEIKSFAKQAHEGLAGRIRRFESGLNEDEEMAVYIASMAVPFRLTGIGDMGGLIVFFGEDPDGRRVESYQHFTQANVTLVAVPKPAGQDARRMGFETPPGGTE